ncbi:hypothetical protein [Streptomyces sp. DvalAA-19]|uniref:hypothetical protein n=1 Tax=Streptomyces sp. DvalAA-19 TaxID=1839761 RepID=UPI00081B4870|nr:hypothetical protein [Streptomyces sp. DvalAA-19]SCE21493.1 hypothetical protein GA0115244_12019 [Streptomyces sp. DvalAA-19]
MAYPTTAGGGWWVSLLWRRRITNYNSQGFLSTACAMGQAWEPLTILLNENDTGTPVFRTPERDL